MHVSGQGCNQRRVSDLLAPLLPTLHPSLSFSWYDGGRQGVHGIPYQSCYKHSVLL